MNVFGDQDCPANLIYHFFFLICHLSHVPCLLAARRSFVCPGMNSSISTKKYRRSRSELNLIFLSIVQNLLLVLTDKLMRKTQIFDKQILISTTCLSLSIKWTIRVVRWPGPNETIFVRPKFVNDFVATFNLCIHLW